MLAVQMACKTIANLINRASIQHSNKDGDDDGTSDKSYYSMKRLDKLSTAVLKNALKFTGTVQMILPEAKELQERPDQKIQNRRHISSQHQPGVLLAYDQHNLA